MNYPFPIEVIGLPAGTYRQVDIRGIGEGADTSHWLVPTEVPIAFIYARHNYSVMLATPQDLVDFAVGFSITEQVVSSIDKIKALEIVHSDLGIEFYIRLDEASVERLGVINARLNRTGNTGCGLCGLKSMDALHRKLPKVAQDKKALQLDAIEHAFQEMEKHQSLNQMTYSVHAAVWVKHDGEILLAREDVGRHNALDKLLGAMMIENIDVSSGFVLMSSRCSYELVEKAAGFGVQAMVTISAPTALAIDKANMVNMALYARSPEGAVEIIS